MLKAKPITVIFPAGQISDQTDLLKQRVAQLAKDGFYVDVLWPQLPSENGHSAGTVLERAVTTCFALTSRKSEFVWAARGGFGTSEIIPHLEKMLPPVIPSKTLVGFSDISLLGNFLACRYKNLKYIHANHFFDSKLYDEASLADRNLLFLLLQGHTPPDKILQADFFCEPREFSLTVERQPPSIPQTKQTIPTTISGKIVPVNLSLAEVLACIPNTAPHEPFVLFTEDINEPSYKILRIFDALLLSGYLKNCQAVVLGNFLNCSNAEQQSLADSQYLAELAQLICKKIGLPILGTQAFGHDLGRLPLVRGAQCLLKLHSSSAEIVISFDANLPQNAVSQKLYSSTMQQSKDLNCYAPSSESLNKHSKSMHFIGIGGTGMASVAGLFKEMGFAITGSDNPIYPPMDATIKKIGVQPLVGYSAENLNIAKPSAVVLANAISRVSADLHPNFEFEELLKAGIHTYSFPSALRHFFLSASTNIVVTGTHGKTTLTSLIAHLLEHGGYGPSFMVGGTPKNFSSGYRLKSKDLFVLEGDEYDSALFDKGPKFLHYEPTIAIINNIEFDHADIYPNIEAIEQEFKRLALLCHARKGVAVVNYDDSRAKQIAEQSAGPIMFFTHTSDFPLSESDPTWKLLEHKATRNGMKLLCQTPWNEPWEFETTLHGIHNARNSTAALAALHCFYLVNSKEYKNLLQNPGISDPQLKDLFSNLAKQKPSTGNMELILQGFGNFAGVKRRFELIGDKNGVLVYDDFAHHPTAIETTLQGFKQHMQCAGMQGRLIACFDPRNATMRRKVLQQQLARSFDSADKVLLGKVAVDKRISQDDVLNTKDVVNLIGAKARCFSDNKDLLAELIQEVKPNDLVVFMSSGSFDHIPTSFVESL